MRVTKGYQRRAQASQLHDSGRGVGARLIASATIGCALLAPFQASAVDGCKVLLCLTGNWKQIPMCVPTVRQALRDMARGKPFPSCSMSGPGNTATHRWASAPAFCPPQYTRSVEGENATHYVCDYRGAVTVQVAGKPWSRVWWTGEDTSTEYFDAARTQLGANMDLRFDQDLAAWVAAQPPSRPDGPHGGY